MEIPNLKSLKTMFLLSIILPISLLAAFKLTELMGETQTIIETKTLQPVEWEFEKPFRSTDWPLWFYNQSETCIKNSYMQGSVSGIFAATPRKYSVNNAEYDGSSVLHIILNLTVSIGEGFIENIRISFCEDYDKSQLRLIYPLSNPYFYTWKNLTLKNYAHCFYNTQLLNGDLKAFIEAQGTNNPAEVCFNSCGIDWILKASENISQQLKITAEVTYFNATSYVKAVLPILIRLVGDIGNSFETARTIEPGNYIANIDYVWDPMDCYGIWLVEGQKIRIQTILRGPGLNLTLYNPDEKVRANLASEIYYDYELKSLNELTYTVDVEGCWYIKVLTVSGGINTYKLIIKVETP